MQCKLCRSKRTDAIFPDAQGGPWFRCMDCGSDSSQLVYDPVWYADFVSKYERNVGSFDASVNELSENVAMFERFRHYAPSNDFLDVGCCDGAGMAAMANAGWSVHGWDVTDASHRDGCTTISDEFAASLFPIQYGAVLCREVIEHVPDWRSFLRELVASVLPGGLLQIQTPRPWWCAEPIVYHREHLQVFGVPMLSRVVVESGMAILADKQWDKGQYVVCRKHYSY